MKTFKLSIIVLVSFLLSTNFTACSNDEEPKVTPIEDEYMFMPFRIFINPSIDITDEPDTRQDEQNPNPVYAIDVQEKNPNTSRYTDYAYGFFKNIDNVIIKLNKNREYRIEAALYYDFFPKWEFRANETSRGYIHYNSYTDGFIYLQNGYFYGIDQWYFPNNDDYHTTDLIEGDGYYGTIETFSPLSNNACSLELKRVASALSISVEGLSEGKIQCILNSPHDNTELEYQLAPDETTLSQTFVCGDLLKEEQAYLRLYVNYIPSVGDPIELIIENPLYFSRNKRKRILIRLNNGEELGNVNTEFSFTKEKVNFIDEEQMVRNCTIS